ncbi:Fc.00g013210.m01.CDS01 [Cosmosporella sp. VM-42]
MGERPAIYLHFEFGVSWTPRHAPRSRQISYMSRNMRDRANQFPRQLPPANTNFLAAPVAYPHPYYQQQYQSQVPQPQSYQQEPAVVQQYDTEPQFRDNIPAPQIQYPSYHPTRQQHQQQQLQEPETQRSPRSQSRRSHERGSSAPPPFNDSPWDAEPEPMTATALPRSSRPNPRPQVWKALPATPAQFRLGEDGMPWSSYTFPMGFVEDGEEEAYDGNESPSTRQSDCAPESSRRRDLDDRDRGRAREMQSLATALMTVDNGFEDQWWYQGPRLVTVAGDLLSPAAIAQLGSRDGTVGWAVSDQEQEFVQSPRASFPDQTPRSSTAGIVSPMSEFPSPMSSYQGLRRSLTTRSDELHM